MLYQIGNRTWGKPQKAWFHCNSIVKSHREPLDPLSGVYVCRFVDLSNYLLCKTLRILVIEFIFCFQSRALHRDEDATRCGGGGDGDGGVVLVELVVRLVEDWLVGSDRR